jgi:N-methylhydantoinase B
MKPPDLLEQEIFRSAAMSVLDEVETNLSRIAYSPLIYEYKDFTVALLTADFRLLSQSRSNLPVFVADVGAPVADAVAQIGANELAEGDVFITNYAAVQGQHLNNVVMATPLFEDGQIAAYLAIRAHWADVGGLAPGSITWDAREIFHEGVQFRGLRFVMGHRVLPEVVATILANTRLTDYVYGDLMAQLACCVLGRRRWTERVSSRWSRSELLQLEESLSTSSAAFARARIAELPDGEYSASCLLDDDGLPGGAPLELRVAVGIDGEQMTIDLRDMPPQVASPINSGAEGGGVSACRLAYIALIAPERPIDHGLLEPLEVLVREGTITSAVDGAPMGHWNLAIPSIVDLVVRAVGQADPTKSPAGHHSTLNIVMFSGRRVDGALWQSIDTLGGGWGGSSEHDGFSPLKTAMHGDNREIPAEILEASFPLKVISHSYIADSAGAGRRRGGFGVEMVIEVQDDVLFSSAMDRTLDPPWGAQGGTPGVAGGTAIRAAGESAWTEARKVSLVPLRRGDRVRIRSHGGGGWGPAEEREHERLEADHRSGLITTASAPA